MFEVLQLDGQAVPVVGLLLEFFVPDVFLVIGQQTGLKCGSNRADGAVTHCLNVPEVDTMDSTVVKGSRRIIDAMEIVDVMEVMNRMGDDKLSSKEARDTTKML